MSALKKKVSLRNNKMWFRYNILPVMLIMISIFSTFLISRIIAYLVLVVNFLPSSLFVKIGDFRLHHFVYGNMIIIITGFLAIGLGIRRHKNLFAVAYGIGLGMVLDEFMLWIGDIKQLTTNTLWIPHSITAVSISLLLLATIIMTNLYELKYLVVKKK